MVSGNPFCCTKAFASLAGALGALIVAGTGCEQKTRHIVYQMVNGSPVMIPIARQNLRWQLPPFKGLP